jgi:hypothetical protein
MYPKQKIENAPFMWNCRVVRECNIHCSFFHVISLILILDPCYVDVSLVLKYAQDINEQEVVDFITSVVQTTSAEKNEKKVVKQIKNRADNLQDGYVELCSPVQIFVLPKSSSH